MTPETAPAAAPALPLTLEGASVLHQMMRFRRSAWRALSADVRAEILAEAAAVLSRMETHADGRESAFYSLLGHKGDLLILHFRRSFEELNEAEIALARLRLGDFLEPATSYLSVTELGLYESSAKVYAGLAAGGLEPNSEGWKAGVEEVLARQRAAMAPRLWPRIPESKYLCFYPMDRRIQIPVLLPHGPPARRIRQLVSRVHGGPPAHDGRARPGRPALRG
ncbi:MAG: chlorite dismutase family protein [Bryobacteraceae bacterium]